MHYRYAKSMRTNQSAQLVSYVCGFSPSCSWSAHWGKFSCTSLVEEVGPPANKGKDMYLYMQPPEFSEMCAFQHISVMFSIEYIRIYPSDSLFPGTLL